MPPLSAPMAKTLGRHICPVSHSVRPTLHDLTAPPPAPPAPLSPPAPVPLSPPAPLPALPPAPPPGSRPLTREPSPPASGLLPPEPSPPASRPITTRGGGAS